MSPGDVQPFQQGNGNAVVIGLGLRAKKEGKWIQIHITGPNDLHTTVTNDPDSVRFHKILYRDFRQTLVEQDCWPYGDEGAEVGVENVDSESVLSLKAIGQESRSQFQPTRLRGSGPTASELVIQERRESRF